MPAAEPLHPSFTEQDAVREQFFAEASEILEDARTARMNPIADKISAVNQEPKKTDDASSRSPAPKEAAPPPKSANPSQTLPVPDPAKIPGPPKLEPSTEDAGEESASPSQLPEPSDKDIPGPDEYRGGKGFVENWKKLHAAKDHWHQQALQLERKLNELTTQANSTKIGPDPETSKRIETLQSERDNLLARLEAVAVEKSPRFEAAFKPRVEAALAQAKAAVGPDRAKLIEEVLSLPEGTYRDERIDGLLNELGTGVRGAKLAQAVADLDRINAERTALASRGSELYKQWQSEEQAALSKQQQERESQASRIFNDELATWREAGYLKSENEVALAKSVFSGQADYTDAARASMWAAVGPQLASQTIASKQRIAELEAEVAKLRSVQPNAAPDAGSKQPQQEDMPDNLGYSDAIARMVQQAGLLR